LFSRQFDPGTLEVTGDPRAIADDLVGNTDWLAEPAFSVSQMGTMAYRLGKNESQLVWFDRAGRQVGTVGDPDTVLSQTMRLVRDERTVALTRTVSGNTDIWIIELTRNVLRRLTFDPADDSGPIWSPDGSQIVFSSRQKLGNLNLYVKPVNGTGSEEPLVLSTENKFAMDWSSDGRHILYSVDSSKSAQDLWAFSMVDKKSFPVLQTTADETNARFSPNGHWIVFNSNETGRNEVYVQPFPGPAVKSPPISTNGGSFPQWRADGKEIFYAGLDNRLMAVPVTLQPNGRVESGVPVSLFQLRPRSEYEVSHDGQRFLIHAPTEDASLSPITIVLNWVPKK
jgi:Tol biopolymer transport system component